MPDYILEESSELAKEARLYLQGMKDGLDLKKILTPRQYIVFYLKIVKNTRNSVIADIIGVRETTVRDHWQSAVQKLRKLAQN